MISLALEDQKPLVYNYRKEYEQRLIACLVRVATAHCGELRALR